MLGVIRVVSLSNPQDIQLHGAKMTEFGGFDTVSACIPDQPDGIFDDASEATAIPKIVDTGRALVASQDLDALTVSCAADPAVDELRAALTVPVIGAGNSGATIARSVGERVGVIGITEQAPGSIVSALGPAFFGYRHNAENSKTTTLENEGTKAALAAKAAQLRDGGANVLLFACTGFSGIGLKAYLGPDFGIPVIDLVEAQATAYKLVSECR